MIGLRKTYQDVAEELAEGLDSGTMTLGDESDRAELASFAFLTFRFLAPNRFAFSAPEDGGKPRVIVERDSLEYEQLAEPIRLRFQRALDELRGRGYDVEIRDSDDRSAMAAT